jgi:hypothetical protein
MNETKKKMLTIVINFFLRQILKVNKILSPRPRPTPFEEVPRGGVAGIAKAMPLDWQTAPPW